MAQRRPGVPRRLRRGGRLPHPLSWRPAREPPLVHLHGAGGMRLTPAHELLCRRYRVIAFEMPGLRRVAGEHADPDHARDLPRRWRPRSATLGVERFNLMGTSFGGTSGAVAGGAAAGTGARAGAGSARRDPARRATGRRPARRKRSRAALRSSGAASAAARRRTRPSGEARAH